MLLKSLGLCCLLLFVSAHGQTLNKPSTGGVFVEKLINRNNVDRYLLSFSLSDGQFRFERGYFRRAPGSDDSVWVVTGYYGYKSPDGQQFSYKFSADEEGFKQQQVQGDEEDLMDVMKRIDPKALLSLVG